MRNIGIFAILMTVLIFCLASCGGGDPVDGDADADADGDMGDADTEPDGDQDEGPPPVEPPALTVAYEPVALTAAAREAVALAPRWVQDDLVINLSTLESIVQDELASLLIELDDARLIDEVAFAIAHTSPEILAHYWFFSELFVLNARLLYEYDPHLQYVDIVDEGVPGEDPDFYSTTTYRIENDDGTIEEVTIDPETYYWYIVHPRLEDELPVYVDGWTSGRAVRPDEGWFWREFLWDAAADECPDDRVCPLLVDFTDGVEVFQRRAEESAYENDGAGQVFGFVGTAIHWGAGTERPVQPNRIYAVACGNCGEYADIHVAAMRTALIPARNCGASSNDHTWVEWWREGVGWLGELHFYRGGVGRDRRDNDCDGIADDALDETDHDGDGFSVMGGDCNDNDEAVYPGATEVQNGYDDDCDGEADTGFVDSELDGDGDGFTIPEGDCRDANAAVFPGAEELENGLDDDCDGVADDGADTSDGDEDGHTIEGGDCDDTNAAIHPEAIEINNGMDDDCNGVADEGFDAHDRDGDGFTLGTGDCNDLHRGSNPDASDVGLSNNRLYTITTARGDSMVGIDRTEAYATGVSHLEFNVTDLEGLPVDGALVTIYGTWAVYGEPDAWAMASEVPTDANGYAAITVGEYNPYGWSVVSEIGDIPGEGYLRQLVDMTDPNETYSVDVRVPSFMPERPEITESDLAEGEEPEVHLSLSLEVESYRVIADGRLFGSFSWEQEEGRVDLFLVDDENYERLEAGEAYDAHYLNLDATTAEEAFELPRTGRWNLVLSNLSAVASTMVGSMTISASPYGDISWTEEVDDLVYRFRIPPGQHARITLDP